MKRLRIKSSPTQQLMTQAPKQLEEPLRLPVKEILPPCKKDTSNLTAHAREDGAADQRDDVQALFDVLPTAFVAFDVGEREGVEEHRVGVSDEGREFLEFGR